MAGVEKRSFDSPDESRTPDKTRADVVHMGGTTAARLTLEPGWSWAECIKPVVGGDSCQLTHLSMLRKAAPVLPGTAAVESLSGRQTPSRRPRKSAG
jgi:hypothetical protein